MDWQPLFAERTAQMRRSTVRELLKLTTQPGMISFAGGLPAPELFPVEEIRQAAEAVLQRHGGRSLQYGETEGLAELRDWLGARYSRSHCACRRENVRIVSGSQQALDLIGKVLLDAGDRVLVENPTYLAMLLAWRPIGVEFVPAPSDADGMRVDQLASLRRRGVKLIYVVPNFQNPQGTTLAGERRRRLTELLRQEELALVEDNPYGELRYGVEALPHLQELDARNDPHGRMHTHVIHIGTFSKVLAPGLRVGWVIAPDEVIDKLVQAKQAADLHTSTFCQHLVSELMHRGLLERHVPRLRQAYQVRRDTMLAALAAHFPVETSWTRPDGGMFLLVTLPEHLDAEAVLRQALAQQVAFVPGADFHVNGQGKNTLRLNFSNAHPEQIEQGIKRLGDVLKEML